MTSDSPVRECSDGPQLSSWTNSLGWLHDIHLDSDRRDARIPLSPRGRALLELLSRSLDQLRALDAAGDVRAVRRLGYALHVVPELLVRPDEFRPRAFRFNLCEPDISPELQAALDQFDE